MQMQPCVIVVWLTAVVLLGPWPVVGAEGPAPTVTPYVSGQFLVATPEMADPRFKHSVIYMIDHDANGAFGLIVNKLIGHSTMANFMKSLSMKGPAAAGDVKLHYGGPVNRENIFMLHSSDYAASRSRVVAGSISFTTDMGLLREIAAGKGPKKFLFVLGYSGWSGGQLEHEIARGDWLVAPATDEAVFSDKPGEVWERIRGSAGRPL